MLNNFKDFPSLHKEGASSKLSDGESPFRIDEGTVPVEILHCQYVLLQRFHCWHAVFEDFLPSVTRSFLLLFFSLKKKKEKIISLGFLSKQFHVTALSTGEEQSIPNLGVCCSVISISEEKSCPFLQDLFFLLRTVFDVVWFRCQIIFSD